MRSADRSRGSAPLSGTISQVVASDRSADPMARALDLAPSGAGRVSPNPLVGAVIERDGEIIGEGFHAELGGLHAERAALADCAGRGGDPAGATMHVTLEPCAHEGRQPPCTEAIIEAGIRRVVVASADPMPHASGQGIVRLREAGIEVDHASAECAAEARALNQPFFKHALTGKPLVVFKAALTLDGRTATAAGDSKWISGEASRRLVHEWRAQMDAICVGISTALADDPLLTARDEGADLPQPLRVVFDSALRLPLDSRLVRTASETPVIAIAGAEPDPDRAEQLAERGVEVLSIPGDGGQRIRDALQVLGERGVTSLLLEGGATLAGSFLDAGEIDELRLFIAPLILGGAESRPLAGGLGAGSVAEGIRPVAVHWDPIGEDMLVRARMKDW